MSRPTKCLWCESEKIIEGKLMAMGGQTVFRPDKVKFFTLAESAVPVLARVCADCGYVDLYASPRHLKKVIAEF
ncbi:MAG: hypothetical protein MUC63_00605 [Planctomycetes bacterium]|jgi:predicted nucleic-acid-binding Zn-ribbon protein|nr:hypothetical protein [Planctomycetota bacterium]